MCVCFHYKAGTVKTDLREKDPLTPHSRKLAHKNNTQPTLTHTNTLHPAPLVSVPSLQRKCLYQVTSAVIYKNNISLCTIPR